AHGDAHRGDLASILVQRESGDIALVVKSSISLVDVKKVRLRVIPHNQVGLAVGVEGNKDGGEAEILVPILDTRFDSDVGEGPVAVVVKEMIGLPGQAARAAIHRRAAIETGGIAHSLGACEGRIVTVEMHVPGDVEIETPVAVVVPPRRTG